MGRSGRGHPVVRIVDWYWKSNKICQRELDENMLIGEEAGGR